MNTLQQLIDNNKSWSTKIKTEFPDYFSDLAKEQHPSILWIGCSDSRVPPSVITKAEPGALFMYRNIANLAIHTDSSFLSVLQYAVEVLKIDEIVVAGHYNCGGVHAACSLENAPDMIDQWIQHIRNTKRIYQKELSEIQNEGERENRLVELNVIEQVNNIVSSNVIKMARFSGRKIVISGLVYDTPNGELITLYEDKG